LAKIIEELLVGDLITVNISGVNGLLKAAKHEHRLPNIGVKEGCFGILINNSRDSLEQLIINYMILWGNMASARVQDATNSRRVGRGNADIDANVGAWGPLRKFLSIL
jgi:hypothetical protein